MTTLFVNACVRGEQSATLKLCREYLDGIENVVEVDLTKLPITPFTHEMVNYRMAKQQAGQFDDPIFDLSKQFVSADHIVIGTPYWDLSFPSLLKVYLEHVSVCDLAFTYTEQSEYVGLCKASELVYITTGGGVVYDANFGFDYFCAIANMFGIPERYCVAAERLDIVGNDVEAELALARIELAKVKAAVYQK